MHRSYGLQGSLKRRYKHPSPTSINGYHAAKKFLSQWPAKRSTFAFAGESGYTHSPSPTGSHTAAYTPKQGPSGQGRYHYPRRIPHVHEHPRAGCQNGKLCRFWVLAGGALPKNAESLRSSDALMRVAAPRRRGPAGLRNLFRFCRNRDLYIRRSWFSACARWGWYYYPRRALRAAETLDGRLSKRLTCRFLALPDTSLIPAAQNIVPFLYRCQKDQRDTRWSFHFCSHLLTCPDRPDRGT